MKSLLILVGLASAGLAHAQDVEKFREVAAKAVGSIPQRTEWTFKGTQTIHGTNHPYVLSLDSTFRFMSLASGPMAEGSGFDGSKVWVTSGAGLPHVVSYSDRDLARLEMYVLSGMWTIKGSPVEIVSVKGDTCDIKCVDGNTVATLTLNAQTHLPESLFYWGPVDTEKWTYSHYTKLKGIQIPTECEMNSGDNHEKITISSAERNSDLKTSYDIPKVSSEGFTFDEKASPEIEVKRMFGYLFVKPLINGKDEGWFFLDTGAEVMVLDPAIAKNDHAKVVGKEAVAGVVGSVTTDFVQGIDFQLGPATLKTSSYMLLDMTDFSKALGIKLAGICGFDFIGRVALDIDPGKPTIGVYAPGKAELPAGSTWSNFLFHGNIPSILCKYEGDHEGIFSLDTGSGSTVDFYSPTVVKYDLLKDRKVSSSQTGGAGGSAESKNGVMEWFTIGAKRFEKPRVGFQLAQKGAFASPFADGNIGMGFMSKFRMILDYQNYRLAFIDRK